ncbi:PilT/PilU family type 4a pilus ATPase [Candidatus Roizmanbacteria bacterium]|nr:PilT/PilU family type 4a pilus ATPase [Candidatus Roizmanbacteria bacterium]
MENLQSLLSVAIERHASDLHVISGYYPNIRINNELCPLKLSSPSTDEDTKQMLFSILEDEQKQALLENKEIDFGYEFNESRFRVNLYYTKNKLAGAFRLIPKTIKTVEELNLPSIIHNFINYKEGFVLLTGPTGEGKSTTLASVINEINLKQSKHIITIEDPIEFTYPAGKSIISQRELHLDTLSWNVALRSVLREDPDIVLIGEMRDYETMQAAITIAETGHLVFSTLHTSTTSDAIDRIIDVFPANQQNQVRNQLASVLKAVASIRLVPNLDGTSRLPALEILMNTQSVSSIIREGKTFMLDNVLETEEKMNMILFEKYLLKMYQNGEITKDTALNYAIRPDEIRKFIQ